MATRMQNLKSLGAAKKLDDHVRRQIEKGFSPRLVLDSIPQPLLSKLLTLQGLRGASRRRQRMIDLLVSEVYGHIGMSEATVARGMYELGYRLRVTLFQDGERLCNENGTVDPLYMKTPAQVGPVMRLCYPNCTFIACEIDADGYGVEPTVY